jgi:hypothetical protein
VTALAAALQTMTDTLAADGYLLHADRAGDLVLVAVEAGPEACEDCLVPKAMMERMILDTLSRAGIPAAGVELSYPAEA